MFPLSIYRCDPRFVVFLALIIGSFVSVAAFDLTKKDNLAVYWGQNSAGGQQQLSAYCQDDTIDNIVLAFLYVFFGPAPTLSQPEIDFANICNQFNDPTFTGTDLADCSFMASQIEACQAKGKIVTLSLGGATGQVGFSSDSGANSLADRIWNEFLGGSSSTRPFGSAVLDGLDLDIESGSPSHYNTFVNRIRSHTNGASKQYYITAAPQCPFPDAWIGDALDSSNFDAVYVQFYNNFCGLDQPSQYNFATWDSWARSGSNNKNIKVYIGAPASPNAAGTGYVSPSTLANFATSAQNTFASFGGVMLWDASEAVANNNYHVAIKNAMVANLNGPNIPAASNTTVHATKTAPASVHVTGSPTRASPTATKSETSQSTKDVPEVPKGAGADQSFSEDKKGTPVNNSTADEPRATRVNSRFFRR
ncbi:glycoside hydrolase [Vararia minispora EC-137]|uniref:Glycoside hydrolase n=1 Tax=Vararia minispora EC-137 TaxID=1314806 RepID=A0ACB8QU93_9AGAM|nr:glycoside hydrolase [Vararia minispora EC-137]